MGNHAPLVRSASGKTVHRRGCSRSRVNTVPWYWAQGRSDQEIESMCVALGVRLCKACKPLEES